DFEVARAAPDAAGGAATMPSLRLLDCNGKVGLQTSARGGHSHIGVEVCGQFDADVAAGRSEFHVSCAAELQDIDFDVAAGRSATNRAIDLSDVNAAAG